MSEQEKLARTITMTLHHVTDASNIIPVRTKQKEKSVRTTKNTPTVRTKLAKTKRKEFRFDTITQNNLKSLSKKANLNESDYLRTLINKAFNNIVP